LAELAMDGAAFCRCWLQLLRMGRLFAGNWPSEIADAAQTELKNAPENRCWKFTNRSLENTSKRGLARFLNCSRKWFMRLISMASCWK
jgi:hypothetical protein